MSAKPGKHKKQFHAKQSRRSKAEGDEIAELERRLAEGAPPRGSNPLAAAAAAAAAAGDGGTKGEQVAGFASARKFEDLPISEHSKQGLREAKYVTMTAVQRAALPHALCGRDVLGAAKTGSGAWGDGVVYCARRCGAGNPDARVLLGAVAPTVPPTHLCLSAPTGKTLAFLLPVMEALYRQRWSRLDGLGALIISPTRELALQVRLLQRRCCRAPAWLHVGAGAGIRRGSQAPACRARQPPCRPCCCHRSLMSCARWGAATTCLPACSSAAKT